MIVHCNRFLCADTRLNEVMNEAQGNQLMLRQKHLSWYFRALRKSERRVSFDAINLTDELVDQFMEIDDVRMRIRIRSAGRPIETRNLAIASSTLIGRDARDTASVRRLHCAK